MSLKALVWAKSTRGHRSPAQKFLLHMLADYHDDGRDEVSVSQDRLSNDCEMPKRTVRWHLRNLEEAGFIEVVQASNQHHPPIYHLMLDTATLGSSRAATIATLGKNLEAENEGVRDLATLRSGRAAMVAALENPHISLNTLNPKLLPDEEEDKPYSLPKWAAILSVHDSWPAESEVPAFIELVESRYPPPIDLELEATKALEWLQKTPKGRRRKRMIAFFTNWLDKPKARGPTPSIRNGALTEEQRLAEVYAAEAQYGNRA